MARARVDGDLHLLHAKIDVMAGKKLATGVTGRTVAYNVKRLRQKADLNYTELSERLKIYGRDIPPLGIRRIEDGERRVDVDDLMALALALNTNVNALVIPAAGSNQILTIAQDQMYPAWAVWNWAIGKAPLNHSLVPEHVPQSERATYAGELFESNTDPKSQGRDPAAPNIQTVKTDQDGDD